MATYPSNLDAKANQDGGGGGEDLAATLILGNISGGTDIVLTGGDQIQGEGRTSGSGLTGAGLIINPGIGGARAATAVFTVVTAPLVAGDFIQLTSQTRTLTGVAGARTSGSNDFDASLGTTALIAAELAAAINDLGNGFRTTSESFGGDVYAVALGSTVTLTSTWPVTGANTRTYIATTTPAGGITPVGATNFTGGVTGGRQGALTAGDFEGSPIGDARGAGAVDLQGRRDHASQVASGAYSFQAGLRNTTSSAYGSTFGRENRNEGEEANFIAGDAIQFTGGYGNNNTILGKNHRWDIPSYNYLAYSSLITGTGIKFDQYMSLGSSLIQGASHQNIYTGNNNYVHVLSSMVSGYNHEFDGGGLNASFLAGGTNTVGAYMTSNFAAGGGLNLGEAGSYVQITSNLIWGEGTQVGFGGTHLYFSSVGGQDARANTSFLTTATPRLAFVNQWGNETLATVMGEVVWGCESNARQLSFVQVQGITANGNPVALRTRNATSPSAYQDDFKIRADQSLSFKGTVTAQEPLTGDSAMWDIDFLIKNLAGTTTIVGTPNITLLHADAGALPWAVSIVANNTNDTAEITVTGEASHTIQWNCVVRGVSAGSAAF
jgi:hypothetical protein